MTNTKDFIFDGGAESYLGTQLLAFLITVVTFGIAYPFALVLMERWKAKHTIFQGRRLRFTGTGIGLFGNWILWLLLCLITFGIYGFWVTPRLVRWRVEHTEIDNKPQGIISNS